MGQLSDSWFKAEILQALGQVEIEWLNPVGEEDEIGIVSVHLSTPTGIVVLD